MKPNKTVFVKVVGEKSGDTFEGNFTIKGSITRRDSFRADAIRRELLGPSPENTPPVNALQGEAFITGQVVVRTLKGPVWWENSNIGQDLEDSNIVVAIYDAILESDEREMEELSKKAEKAASDLRHQDEIDSVSEDL